jgi:hypothetical protein
MKLVIIGMLIGVIGVALADYISKRTHCYAGRWAVETGWICTVARPD